MSDAVMFIELSAFSSTQYYCQGERESALATIVDGGSPSRKGDSRHHHQQPNNEKNLYTTFPRSFFGIPFVAIPPSNTS